MWSIFSLLFLSTFGTIHSLLSRSAQQGPLAWGQTGFRGDNALVVWDRHCMWLQMQLDLSGGVNLLTAHPFTLRLFFQQPGELNKICICFLVAVAKPCLFMYSEIPSAPPLIHIYIIQGRSGLCSGEENRGLQDLILQSVGSHTQLSDQM